MVRAWAGYGLETGVAWPKEDVTFTFRGYEMSLDGIEEDMAPTVRLYYEDPKPTEEIYTVLRRFLSALSWVEGECVRGVVSGGGGARMRFVRTSPGVVVTDYFHLRLLPEPTDRKPLLALALYREALSVQSTAYSFLSFFKTINVVFAKGDEQRTWIASTIPRLTKPDAVRRLSELPGGVDAQAEYLYGSGRCAIAHAFDQPVVDVDEVADEWRLSKDMPVVRELAEKLMIGELGLTR